MPTISVCLWSTGNDDTYDYGDENHDNDNNDPDDEALNGPFGDV